MRYSEIALVRGLNYLAESQSAIAHNLANVDTTAFKRRAPTAVESRDTFDEVLGRRLPTVAYTERTDWRTGSTRQSGSRLDVALGPDSWLRVQHQSGETFYTRDGRMHLDKQGRLVDHAGLRYLDTGGNSITLGDGEATPNQLSIAPDGQITDPTTGQTLGTLGVWKVEQPQALLPRGAGTYTDVSGKAPTPSPGGLQQGFQEGSNVSSTQELVQMIQVERGFTATQRALTAVGRMQDALVANLNR